MLEETYCYILFQNDEDWTIVTYGLKTNHLRFVVGYLYGRPRPSTLLPAGIGPHNIKQAKLAIDQDWKVMKLLPSHISTHG